MEPTDIMTKAKIKRLKGKKKNISFYISEDLKNRFRAAVPKGLSGHVIEQLLEDFLAKNAKKLKKDN